MEVRSERRHLLARQIDEKTFGEDDGRAVGGAETIEELPPCLGFPEVERHSLQATAGTLLFEKPFLVAQDIGEIHLHPVELRGKIESIGTRVEPGREVQNEVRSLVAQETEKQLVEYDGSNDHRTGGGAPFGNLSEPALVPLAGEPSRVRIAKQGVRTLRFHRPVESHPAGGVGDVVDGQDTLLSRERRETGPLIVETACVRNNSAIPRSRKRRPCGRSPT